MRRNRRSTSHPASRPLRHARPRSTATHSAYRSSIRHLAAIRNPSGIGKVLLQPGRVVWVLLSYADGTGAKVRPAIVIASTLHDVEIAPCTTNVARAATRGGIQIDDLDRAGLHRPTAVLPHSRRTVERSSVVGVAGSCSPSLTSEISSIR